MSLLEVPPLVYYVLVTQLLFLLGIPVQILNGSKLMTTQKRVVWVVGAVLWVVLWFGFVVVRCLSGFLLLTLGVVVFRRW